MEETSREESDALKAEVRRLEDELRIAKEKLAGSSLGTPSLPPEVAAVIVNLPVVLWNIDRSGVITLSEGRGLQTLGLKPGQLVGANVFEVYSSDPQALEPIRESLEGEGGYSFVDVGGAIWENRY